MKIGVGIITMGVRTINPKMYTNTTYEIFVYTDEERKGVSHARNKVLEHFDGYDHVFIFDDDCYPTRPGWEDFFIEHAQKNGVHYMALPEIFCGDLLDVQGEMTTWFSALGCFIYQNALAIQIIGGYNTAYNRYGYEDAGRSHRAIKAGLTGSREGWMFPLRGLGYIYSEDVYGDCPTPNISTEDKQAYIKENSVIYTQEMAREDLFYPYK
ncbi:hypothetical protein [Citrobacter phage Tr1]|nr:hypothetical protein [Citrobacter phage Tr1]